MRRLKPIQAASGPKSIVAGSAPPLRRRRGDFAFVSANARFAFTCPSRDSLMPNECLYNGTPVRLKCCARTWARQARATGGRHEQTACECGLRRSARRARRQRVCAGEDVRSENLALGAAVAPAAEGAGGLGRIGREG